MISNDAQFRIVQEQIQRLKSALSSLERDTKPNGDRQFQVLSEGYVDQIAELEALADAYVAKSIKQSSPLAGTVASK